MIPCKNIASNIAVLCDWKTKFVTVTSICEKENIIKSLLSAN